jgi:hypothetical protein
VTLSARAQQFGTLLAAAGGALPPADLGARAGVGKSVQAESLGQLRKAGLVEGPKSDPRLSAAGWARFGTAPAVGADPDDELERALAVWSDAGLYAHRAFLELLLSTIVARHHLHAARPGPFVGFMAIGETGTGKSALADAACAVLGLDPLDVTRLADQETERSLLGRREKRADVDGGGWTFEPASLTALPFVFLDEFDKAEAPVRTAAMRLFQGQSVVVVEGERITLAPTPMLGANPPRRSIDRLEQLRPEYRRRSVVLDAGYAVSQRAQLRAALADHTPPARPPRPLQALVLPERLPHGCRSVLRSVEQLLTEDGLALLPNPHRDLEAVALGRAALLGAGADLGLATWSTAVAFLTVASTVPGLVDDGWRAPLEAIRGAYVDRGVDVELADLVRAVEHAELLQDRIAAEARARRLNREATGLVFVGARARLVAELEQAEAGLRQVPRSDRTAARGIRAQLVDLRRQASQSRTADRLDDVHRLASEPLAAAVALRHAIEDERQRVAEAREQRARQGSEARALAAEHRRIGAAQQRARQAQLRDQLSALRATAKRLEQLHARSTTQPGESALQTLRGVALPGGHRLLEYVAHPREVRGATGVVLEALSGARRHPGLWRSTADHALNFPGGPTSCAALATWGPATRAVLEAALRRLYEAEDLLQRSAGGRGRQRLELS